MKFLEYQVKERFRAAGVPVPDGRLARTPDEAALAAGALGPIAVKAQVPVGGRGKAGGIKLAKTPEEARTAAAQSAQYIAPCGRCTSAQLRPKTGCLAPRSPSCGQFA